MRMNNLERNKYVCEQIENAVLKLLQQKELNAISIKEITEEAQVSRVSFYRNYDDKEDVLKTYIGRMVLTWGEENKERFDKAKAESGNSNLMLSELFSFLKSHEDLIQLLQKRGLFDIFRDSFLELYGPKPEYPNAGAYLSAFFFYGLYGWIEEWVKRGMQESGDAMVQLFAQMNH